MNFLPSSLLLILTIMYHVCQKSATPVWPTASILSNCNMDTGTAPVIDTLTSGAIYRIRALAAQPAGPVMEVTGSRTAQSAKIQQWGWFANNGQKWKLIKTDDAYWNLINSVSGKCLEPSSLSDGALLHQAGDNGSDRQRWKIDHAGNGYFTLTNKASGMKAVVAPNDGRPGRRMIQTTRVTGTADRFEFHNLFFKNPVIKGRHPDPYVAERNGFYYFLSTKVNRISIIKTQDMSLLNIMPEKTVWTPPPRTPYSTNIWAPELHFLDGKWYIYFAANDGYDVNHRMYVIENTNEDPTTRSWTFKGKITDASDQWAIDGSVLVIGSSKWFIWSGWENESAKFKQCIYIAKMRNPWSIAGSRVKISSPSNDWEKHEANGMSGPGVNEGPIVVRKDQFSPLFLIFSASRYTSDDYCLGQIQLQPESDPMIASNWVNKQQVFVQNPANAVYAPGHNSFFTSTYIDPDKVVHKENWIIYHARSKPNAPNGMRTTRMQQFTWNTDGSPRFGTPVKVNTDLNVPVGE